MTVLRAIFFHGGSISIIGTSPEFAYGIVCSTFSAPLELVPRMFCFCSLYSFVPVSFSRIVCFPSSLAPGGHYARDPDSELNILPV